MCAASTCCTTQMWRSPSPGRTPAGGGLACPSEGPATRISGSCLMPSPMDRCEMPQTWVGEVVLDHRRVAAVARPVNSCDGLVEQAVVWHVYKSAKNLPRPLSMDIKLTSGRTSLWLLHTVLSPSYTGVVILLGSTWALPGGCFAGCLLLVTLTPGLCPTSTEQTLVTSVC